MDQTAFASRLPRYTVSELQQVRLNCLGRERDDLVLLVEAELRKRAQPKKSRIRSKKKTPVRVTFDGEVREWPHAKDAYVWLLEKFIVAAPHIFAVDPSQASELAPGKRRNHFADIAKELFYSSPHLALSDSNFVLLSNGWVADVNVSNDRKLEILFRISREARLGALIRWNFEEVLYPQPTIDFF